MKNNNFKMVELYLEEDDDSTFSSKARELKMKGRG